MSAARTFPARRIVFTAIALAILFAAYAILRESAYLPSAHGTVRDSTGRPVAGAIVFRVQQVTEKQTWNFHGFSRHRCVRVDAAITDASGRFELGSSLVPIPKGWDFVAGSVQYHIVAKGYRSTTAGDSLDLPGSGRIHSEHAIASKGMINAVMQPAGSDLFVSPWLAAVLGHCEIIGADLGPARQGFAKIFERANLETESFQQRKWLNAIGNVALRSRFARRELPASSQPPTNEQLRALLAGDTEIAKAQIVFREAVIANDVERLRDLLTTGIDVNFDDGYRRSRLGLALENGSYAAYRLLRENGARWRDGEPEEILYLLVSRGDIPGTKILAGEGTRADVPVADSHNVAFISAAAKGYTAILRLLLTHDLVANIDAVFDTSGGNALQQAFDGSHIQAFRLLLTFGADPDIKDKYGRSLFERAVMSRPDFAIAMLQHGVTIQTNSRGHSLLTSAIRGDNHILAEMMLNAGFSPAAATGTAPLAAAVGKGWQGMVQTMLQHPDSLPGSKAWWKALRTSAARGHALFGYLLASYDGPLSDPPPKDGCAICGAAAEGRRDAVEQLLSRGLPIDVRDSDNETALIHAARNTKLEMVRFLIGEGANLSLVGKDGISALAYAADGGNRERREAPWFRGTSVMAASREPENGIAPSRKQGEKLITVKPLDLEDRPSHQAPSEGVKLTMRFGSAETMAVRLARPRNRLPVDPRIVELLLKAGADPNLADETGWTALMRAAACGETEVVQMLLGNGANSKLKNQEGKTAADIAADAGHPELAAMLR